MKKSNVQFRGIGDAYTQTTPVAQAVNLADPSQAAAAQGNLWASITPISSPIAPLNTTLPAVTTTIAPDGSIIAIQFDNQGNVVSSSVVAPPGTVVTAGSSTTGTNPTQTSAPSTNVDPCVANPSLCSQVGGSSSSGLLPGISNTTLMIAAGLVVGAMFLGTITRGGRR